jgi:acyl-CoA thioesterase-1
MPSLADYQSFRGFRRRIVGAFLACMALCGTLGTARAADPLRLVVFGDSLSAGYQLAADKAFPAQLEAALRAKGHAVSIVNAGVSGDTASAGLERLDWSVAEGTDGVIVELGANDALRGIDPAVTRKALAGILARLKERNIPVLLAGMLAPPNMGHAFTERFNTIYDDLAREYGVPLYPFFLEGVAANQALLLADGMHPSPEGVAVIVKNILPAVEKFLAALPARR